MTAQFLWALIPDLLLAACIPRWPTTLCAALGMRKTSNLPVAKVLK